MKSQTRHEPRARDLGIEVGILPTGPVNAVTDVEGVRVGHTTLWRGASVRTGVTVVVPHAGNLVREKVAGAVCVGNGHGKLTGSTQVDELGTIEAPIALTNTLDVPTAMRALIGHALRQHGNESVSSVNVVVGETHDGWLHDIRGLHLEESDVIAALESAAPGPVEEGAVGAGTGTSCFGFKGGIGTSSRRVAEQAGGYTVGALVQTNYGGMLTVNGAPVGRELAAAVSPDEIAGLQDSGSCMVVIATDAPLSPRNLKRLARRAFLGLARTGSTMDNGSGEYAIAFSTAHRVADRGGPLDPPVALVSNSAMNPLFLAAVEATEEAVYNSLFKAVSVTGCDGHERKAIPVDRVIEVCGRYGVLHFRRRLPGADGS